MTDSKILMTNSDIVSSEDKSDRQAQKFELRDLDDPIVPANYETGGVQAIVVVIGVAIVSTT